MKKINSMEELKKVLEIEGEVVEGFILLNRNIRSSKSICNLGDNEYSIINENDGSEDILTFEELSDNTKTNIGDAVVKGAFYLYHSEEQE